MDFDAHFEESLGGDSALDSGVKAASTGAKFYLGFLFRKWIIGFIMLLIIIFLIIFAIKKANEKKPLSSSAILSQAELIKQQQAAQEQAELEAAAALLKSKGISL